MLVLSRNPGERFTLVLVDGQEIEVLIAEVRGRKVRLGIIAPPAVQVYRSEVLTDFRRAKTAAPAPDGVVSSDQRGSPQ